MRHCLLRHCICIFFEDLVDFYFLYNCTVPCIVEFTGHLLSDDTTSSTGIGGNGNNQWNWKGMKIKLN